MIMKVQQTFAATNEAIQLASEKKSLPMNDRTCVSPFTFSQQMQTTSMGSFNSTVPLKYHTRHDNRRFPT